MLAICPICVCTNELRAGSEGMPLQKVLKIRVSKMAISYILRQIPCLSANELNEELKGLFLG